MARVLLIFGLIIAFVLLGVGAMLYMAYGIRSEAPKTVIVAGLGDSSTVVRFENGSARIRASSREDAYASLGYLHGQDHAWSMALWRQAATGRLSEWFGGELLPLDRLTRRLRLGELADEAYAALSEDEKLVLDSYARGVNAAFSMRRTRLANEFVRLQTDPEPWEPWHALAVERLFAWVSAVRPDPDSLRSAPTELREFFEADRLLQRWLHLHGFENGVVWTMQDSSGTRFVQRHIYGASALPIYHVIGLEWPGSDALLGASLIGTPFMTVGRSSSRAWGILLSSSLELTRTQRDTFDIPITYDRIRTVDGREHLLRLRAGAEDVFFPAEPRPFSYLETRPGWMAPPRATETTTRTAGVDTAAADTATAAAGPRPQAIRRPQRRVSGDTLASPQTGWALKWSGFRFPTDAAAWLALTGDAQPSFSLFSGVGMTMTRDGSVAVQGSPDFVVPVAGGHMVGNSRWSTYAAYRLDSLSAPDVTIETADLISDRESAWAAWLAPPLTEAAIAVPEQPHLMTEALTYLRNWDFAYDRASIAASIFDRWMAVYQDSLGHIPEPQVADTALAENLVRYETLVRTVEMLAQEYGEDLSAWRWEVVEPHRYYFPAWSADSLVAGDLGFLKDSRYAPIVLPGSGHPTTVYFGPSPLAGELDAPARWESWLSTNDWEAFRYRQRQFPANRFFGRYLVSDRTPEPATLPDPTQSSHTVHLIPE